MAEYAKAYGEIFLLKMGRRNFVVVSSPETAMAVLQTHGIAFGSRSRNIVFDIFTGRGQDMVFAEYGEHWRKMRRIMTIPLFTNKVVQKHMQDLHSEVSGLIDDVHKSSGGIVIKNNLEFLMYNVLYKIMFDHRFDSAEDHLYIKLRDVNAQRSRLGQSFDYNFVDFFPILKPFMRTYLNLCKDVKERRLKLYKDRFLDKRIKKILVDRASGNKSSTCGMDYILEALQNGEINETNLLYIVENMNVAAIDTTLSVMEWGIAELANHPHVQKRLRQEIKESDQVITEVNNFQKLPYLEAVIKETLRLRMPVTYMVPHMNLDEAKLGGFDIPAESTILVNAWWIANNPDHWKDPGEFRPERFLENESTMDVNGNDSRYFPFGVGRRSCSGIFLALPLIGITLGRLVQNFEMLPPPGECKIDTTENGGQFTLRILKHSPVVFKPVVH